MDIIIVIPIYSAEFTVGLSDYYRYALKAFLTKVILWHSGCILNARVMMVFRPIVTFIEIERENSSLILAVVHEYS